jgi:two-component system, LytTR family, sensor kinase
VNNKIKYNKISTLLKVLLVNLILGLFITYFFVNDFFKIWGRIIPTILYSLFMGITIWLGNEYVSRLFDKKVELRNKPERKLVIGMLLMVLFTFIAIVFVNFVWLILWEKGNVEDFKMPRFQIFAVIIGITFIISFILSFKEFVTEKKHALIKEERLKTEIIKLEYETLKNQVNPHFLFNSLNALTSLVAENDEAVRFIKNLADVYRYVLDQKDKELVELDRELEFVSAYLYLHQIRFGKNLEIEICKAPANKMVVPLAVQMLVENAIKHNEISIDAPLKISIFIENDFLVINNNLQLKSMVGNSSKIGLENIKLRYAYLTKSEIIVESKDNKFNVKIPLMEFKK